MPERRARQIRLAIPLAGHLIPTTVVGYGVVLPSAGLSAHGPVGLGFGASLVGTVLAYVIGVRLAGRRDVHRRPGPLGRLLSAQAAHPHGLLGHVIGRIWLRETAAVNDRATTLLGVSPGDSVLEIGCGPGRAIAQLAAREARVIGVDPSEVMLAHARRRNRTAIRDGRVELRPGRAQALPVPDRTVHAVLAVHSIYFWGDLGAGLREVARVLLPGGRVVLAFRDAELGLPRRFDPAVYRVPPVAELRKALTGAGFTGHAIEADLTGIVYVSADRAPQLPTHSEPGTATDGPRWPTSSHRRS